VSHVVAVITTYRRPAELARLLNSLADTPSLVRAIVVDNGGDLSAAALSAGVSLPLQVTVPGRNLGCGGGVAHGLSEALRDPGMTHAWILDDDALAAPGALPAMVDGMERTSAAAAVPLVTDAAGRIGWFPGPLRQPAWDNIRTRPTPQQFRAHVGLEPLDWAWSPWTSLLVTRLAIEKVGLPRDDFWFQGEDLEWTLRISAHFRAVLVAAAECRHLPPSASGAATNHATREALKTLSMLQNNAFTAAHLPHGRRMWRHVPGNAWRFLREQRFAPSAWRDVWAAHWWGIIRGLPAGRATRWQQRWSALGMK
jgi:GT2 family glycosyltransferase